jgi:hypothetical protein
MVWQFILSMACLGIVITMSNKNIHKKFNDWTNEKISKIRNK